MSRLDHVYRSLLLTKFFTKGWGRPDNLKRLFEFRKILSNRDSCKELVSADYPVHIDKDELQKECRVVEGHFVSPLVGHLPGIMPKEVEMARFQMILPHKWRGELKPICLHLAGTGDHFYWRRRMLLARPLLKEAGIGSILLENPYYGVRKPKQQLRSSLLNVSDLFVMGGALVLESLALFHWCERMGYGPLGITGISMGGHMASLAATNWHKPIPLVPCLSWSTASAVFTQGVMSGAIPWGLLQEQFLGDKVYEDEITKLIHSPEQNKGNEAFLLGQKFAKNYPKSLQHMRAFQDKYYKGEHDHIIDADFMTEYDTGAKDESKLETVGKHSERRQVANSTLKCPPDGLKSTSASYHTLSSSSGSETNVKSENKSSDFDTNRDEPEGNATDSKVHSYNLFNRLHISDTLKKMKLNPKKNMRNEALDFMRGVMDECTHLGNFSVPVDPSLVIVVAAKADAYVPRDSVLSLQDLWPGCEVRYVDSGHIGAFLFKQNIFRKAIIDAFDRQIQKYYS